jgi:CheY-like chemotaxis protein
LKIREQEEVNQRLARYEAIANMTQMLAHDVRKPFSLLRMGMAMLGNAHDPASVKQVLFRIIPEIDKAVQSVDGMIADVMEVGSPAVTLIQEPMSPECMIVSILDEQIRIHPKANISFRYNYRHVHMMNVHVHKVGRVFSNIIGNAIQAMRTKGSMWFETSESAGMILFCIGNSGSVVPEESLKHLFDAFFTSGKKGGTGLGLAIAQKIVSAHGGKIWCDSSKTSENPDGKVEFFFTLPIAIGQLNHNATTPPQNSSEIAQKALMPNGNGNPPLSIDNDEETLEDEIMQSHIELGRSLQVLIIDDESIYRTALASYLKRTPELEKTLSLTLADGSESAIEATALKDFDLIITDVDMGNQSLGGFELVRDLRNRGSKALICVHSNRIVAADSKTALDVGADNFLPKPMARAQLLRVLLQAARHTKSQGIIERRSDSRPFASATIIDVNKQTTHNRPGVLVIDDSELVLCGWEFELGPKIAFYSMKSFEELQEQLASEPTFLENLNYVVTDMHLDGSYGNGLDVGRLIKSLKADLPVLLSSDDTFKEADLIGAVDKVIAKVPVTLSMLTQWRTKL